MPQLALLFFGKAPAEANTRFSGLKAREWVHALGWARVSEGGQPSWWEAKPGSLDPAPLPSTSERDLQRAQDKASTPPLAKNIKKKL